MLKSITLALKYLTAALAVTAACAVEASCLNYGPASLTGIVVRQTYAGPPDYESITKGDRPVVIYVLQLDRSLCVVDAQGRYSKEYAAREIQLEWPAGSPEPFRDLLGTKVTVTGELIRGGARHDKRLVIVATQIGAVRR